METTDEAEPTITSPITQSSPTTTARTVPVGSSATVAAQPGRGDGVFAVTARSSRAPLPRVGARPSPVAVAVAGGVTAADPAPVARAKSGPTPDTSAIVSPMERREVVERRHVIFATDRKSA